MSWNGTTSQRRWILLSFAASLLFAVTAGYSEEEKPAATKPVAKKPVDKAAKIEKPAATKPASKKQAGKKAADKKKVGKKPPANPLSKLIRNIFGGRKAPAGKLIPADTPAEGGKGKLIGNGDRTARDHIDSRAPFDSRQASRLRKARSLIKEKHYKQAAEWLQRILDTADDDEDSLIRLPDGKLMSVRRQANQLLGQFPADALDGYRRVHGGYAEQQMQDARARGDLAGIVKVADKYFHTKAGYEASNYIGTLHVDRGEFGPAVRRFLQLVEADAPVTHDPQWRMKAAFAFREAGQTDGSEKLLSALASLPAGGLQVGGRDINPADWLNGLSAVASVTTPPLDEWLMVYGTPRRTGTAVGGDPLLLQRWLSPLTHNQGIAEQIEILLEDLADQNRTTVPAWFPLAVDGKVVFRTMRGVQVVDAQSGKPLWETRAGVSPERVLTGQSVAQYAQSTMAFRVQVNGMLGNFRNYGVDQHPLASLLFRDGTYGVLSSDGRRLFVIEDHAVLSSQQPGYYWGSRMNQNDPFRRDWSSNKIAAYGLSNGRPLWEIGGRATNEVFEPPFAGTYFFGAPTSDGREMFAIGEKDNEIRLFSLDPETGDSKWFQLLAISETKIQEDYGRRWWNAQVAVGNGVLVCPTTVGWLVAVDRTSHAILWAYRYSQPAGKQRSGFNNNRQSAVVPNSTVNQRWSPSAPVIVGNYVIYTPSEYTKPQSQQTSVICLNLLDGTRVWQKPKGTFRYLAGVFDKRVVLVGTSSVTALSLDKGTTLWSRPITNADGHPAGFGVAVGNRYHLPLNSGQVWTIDLANGSVLTKSHLSDGETRLGNLAMYRGMMLSLSPRGLTSFEQRGAIVAEIRRRQEQDPKDAWALGRQADIHMLNRDYPQALGVLNTIPADRVEPDQVEHYRDQMLTCLTELVRSDFTKHEPELDQLAKFVQTPAEKLHFQRLLAERLDVQGKFAAAFDIYQQLAGEDRQLTIPRGSDPKVSLPLQRWIAGRLRDLWSRIPKDERADLDRRIAAVAEKVAGESSAAQERFAVLFDFHPTSQKVRNQLVDGYADRGELARAQMHLERLSRVDDEQVAAAALLRLARLMQERNLKPDARYYFEHLTRRYAKVDVGDGTTAADLYKQLQAEGAFQSDSNTDLADWGDYDLKLERTGAGYSSSQLQEFRSSSFQLPYLRQFRYQVDQQQQKLAVINLADGKLHWLVPLRSQSRSSQGYPVAQAAGHRLFVLHRDVLHCLSPVERKVLWTRSIQSRGAANRNYRNRNQQNTQPMKSANSIISGQSLAMRRTPTGLLAVANSNYVCVYGRRKFTVLDAATGVVRWTRNRVPVNTKLVGSEDVLYMISTQNRNQTAAFRAADGNPLKVANIGSLLAKAVSVSNDGLVLVESRAGSRFLGLASKGSTVVRLYDPLLKKNHWRHSFPNGAYFSILDEGSLTVLRKDNTVALLNLDDGGLKELGKLGKTGVKSRSQIYTIADRDNVYFIANKSSRSKSYYSLGLPFVRVNGTIFAFDRHKGKQLWKQDVPNQNLVLSQFANSPMLTFAMRTYVRKGPLNYWTLGVVAIDKKSGRKLLNTTAPFNNSFRSVDVNLADRYVELRSYNDRIRLIAVDRKTAAAK